MAKFKMHQRVKIDNRFNTAPEAQVGEIVQINVRYAIKIDSGFTFYFDEDRIQKIKEVK
jgi:hypothetical protein